MKKFTGIGIGLVIISTFLIPRINFELTSYAKIYKTSTNYEILSFSDGGDNTMGVSVWNKDLEQEEIFIFGLGWGNMFDDEEIFFYEPFNISDKFGDLLLNGGHVKIMSFSKRDSGVVIEDVDGYDHVFAWGDNARDQTGTGLNNNFISDPVEITENFGNVIIDGGNVTNFNIEASAILTVTDIYGKDHIFSWGSSGENGLNHGASFPEETTDNFYDQNDNLILENGGKIIDSSSFYGSTLIVLEDYQRQDHLFAWGYNESYQLGMPESEGTSMIWNPAEVDLSPLEGDLNNGYHIISVDNAQYTSGMILENSMQQSSIYFWGGNELSEGALGWGDTEYVITPTNSNQLFGDYLNDNSVKYFSMGSNDTMIVFENKFTDQDSIFMTGDNSYGQLGIGYKSPSYSDHFINITEYMPDLNDGGKVLGVEMNNATSYLFTSDSSGNTHIYSWGLNSFGELGIGRENIYYLPFPVEIFIP